MTDNNIRYVDVATITTGQQERKQIPNSFIHLQSQGENNLGSTEKFGKSQCERYLFIHEDNWLYFDITFELMNKLNLEHGKDCSKRIYINKELLNKKPEYGGITIDNENDICLAESTTTLVTEQETQTNESNQQREQLEIERIALRERISALTRELENSREEINDLTERRNNLLTHWTNLSNTINNVQFSLSIEDLNNLPVLSDGESLNSLLVRPTPQQLSESEENVTELSELLDNKNAQIVNLFNTLQQSETQFTDTSRELTNAQTRIIQLTAQIDYLQNQLDRTNDNIRELNNEKDELDASLATKNSKISELARELQQVTIERNNLEEINQIQSQQLSEKISALNYLESQKLTKLSIQGGDLNKLLTELKKIKTLEELHLEGGWIHSETLNNFINQNVNLTKLTLSSINSLYPGNNSWGPPLFSLDLSQNTKLTELSIGISRIEKLNIRENADLTAFYYCISEGENMLQELDLSQNTNLARVQVRVQSGKRLKVKAKNELMDRWHGYPHDRWPLVSWEWYG